MGVKVEIKGSVPTEVWDQQASHDLAALVARVLDQRAFVRALDVNDSPYAPYTAAYAAQRRAAGDGGKPDLQASGRLRAALQSGVRVTPEGVTLTVPAAFQGQAEGLQSRRRFWGVSPGDERAVQAEIEKVVEAAMKRSEGGNKP